VCENCHPARPARVWPSPGPRSTGLGGQPVPPGWDDAEYLLKATGRTPLTGDDRTRLGALADRFPLLG
jgi:hypothetical protein